MPTRSSRLAPLILSGATLLGCGTTDLPLDSGLPTFDVDVFEAELIDRMGTQPVGWAYVINQNGQLARSGAFGKARLAVDGEIDLTIDKPVNYASVTKWLSAIAVMQLLDERGLTVDSLIEPWLPPGWQRGPGVTSLTFRDLMSHGSGLQSQNNNFSQTLCYDCLRTVIETGVVNAKTYAYLNANFALLRIIVPMLWAGLPGAPAVVLPTDATTTQVYQDYMQARVFGPIGVTSASLQPEARTLATLYYNVADPGNGTSGTAYGDWRGIAGGGGYFLSTRDAARLLAFYEHSDQLVDGAARTVMKDGLCGFDLHNPGLETEGGGPYYHKNGAISNTAGQGMSSDVAIFPNGVQVAVVTNTQGIQWGVNGSLRGLIYRAYNAAWQ